MKRLVYITFMVFIAALQGVAQTPVEKMYTACLKMSKAVGSSSSVGMRSASEEMKTIRSQHWGDLRYLNKGKLPSLNSHFLFIPGFADSLINNRKVYDFAQRYYDDFEKIQRGGHTSTDGVVKIRTLVVDAGRSATWRFVGRSGNRMVAFVAEPKGALKMDICDAETGEILFTQTSGNVKGAASAFATFMLAKKRAVEITITNKGKRCSSFALMTNTN